MARNIFGMSRHLLRRRFIDLAQPLEPLGRHFVGQRVGDRIIILGNDVLPDHQLALSNILHSKIASIELNKEQALQYLRKEEVKVDTAAKGWMVVGYEGFRLGWVKVLQDRVNNYYPKEWRILKSA